MGFKRGIFVTWYCYKEVLPGSLGVSVSVKMKIYPYTGIRSKAGFTLCIFVGVHGVQAVYLRFWLILAFMAV